MPLNRINILYGETRLIMLKLKRFVCVTLKPSHSFTISSPVDHFIDYN